MKSTNKVIFNKIRSIGTREHEQNQSILNLIHKKSVPTALPGHT